MSTKGSSMAFLDKVKGMFNSNKDKVADGVDKATDVIDDKTGGKHSDHLQKVDDAVDKATGQQPDA